MISAELYANDDARGDVRDWLPLLSFIIMSKIVFELRNSFEEVILVFRVAKWHFIGPVNVSLQCLLPLELQS